MELYNANEMPLASDEKTRNAQEKFLRGEKLSLFENMALGRDHVIKEYAGYQFKPDHAYRAISEKLFNIYKQEGKIVGVLGDPEDEYLEFMEDGKLINNNKGVDWYLGGACLRYGDIIIECPCDKNYFQPAFDNGNHLSADPTVKFMKSSGSKNPIPTSMITKAFRINKELDKSATQLEMDMFYEARRQDMETRNIKRQELIKYLELDIKQEEQEIGGVSL